METYTKLDNRGVGEDSLAFCLGSLAAQIPSFFLLRNTAVVRSLPFLAVLHGE